MKGGGHISREEADNKRFTAREGVGGGERGDGRVPVMEERKEK